MCGILGAMFFPTEKKTKNRLWAAQMILAEAFAESKDRGKDASGAAVIAGDYYAVVKGPWESEEFMVKDTEEPITSPILKDGVSKPFEAFNQICRHKEKDLSLIMMHTRAKTQGSEYENKNNHPILIPNKEDEDAIIIGVHNGVIRNDTQIRKQLRLDGALVTDAEVDSAAIFEVINNALGEEEPTLELMDEIAKWLDGQMAVCAISRHHSNKVMFWRDGRPLEYLVSKDSGIVFFSSDDKYVKEAVSRYNRGRLLFKERRGLPEIKIETKLHTDDWSVLFDTSKILGTSAQGTYGIAEFAKEKRTVKEIYTCVQAPISSTTTRGAWSSGYSAGAETAEDRAKRYLLTISNTIEKEPAVSKDAPAPIEDLSPSKETELIEEEAETTENCGRLLKGHKPFSLLPDEVVDDEVVVEGEILTKPSSDNGPDDSTEETSGNSLVDTLNRKINEGRDESPLTTDTYEAAQEELDRLKEGDSVISSLEEVLERCLAEPGLGAYTDSIEAMRDLYDAVFEEAFSHGADWRDKEGLSTLGLDKHSLEEIERKVKALDDNRDEIERLLNKEIEKRLNSQGHVLTLRITLKVVLETVLARLPVSAKNTLINNIHEALIANKVMRNGDADTDISEMILPLQTALKKTTATKTIPSPVKRIDKFLNSMGDFMKNRARDER